MQMQDIMHHVHDISVLIDQTTLYFLRKCFSVIILYLFEGV